jgi:hypothetical protein
VSVYIARGTQTAAAKTALTIISTATMRPRIKKLVGMNIGSVTLDAQIEVQVSRFTAAGTTTAVTVNGTDSADPAAVMTFGSNATVEPTYTANTLLASLIYNPRGQSLWQAYDKDAELLLPATAANGAGALLNTLGGGTTVVVEGTVQQ